MESAMAGTSARSCVFFADQSHAVYYSYSFSSSLRSRRFSVSCGNGLKKKQRALEALISSAGAGAGVGAVLKKKKLKRLDELSRDFSALLSTSSTGGSVPDAPVADSVRAQILSEALEMISRQVEHTKAERKERKRQKKAEKRALKESRKMKMKSENAETSSSESSSDGDCQVVSRAQLQQIGRNPGNEDCSNRFLSQEIQSNLDEANNQTMATTTLATAETMNPPENVETVSSGSSADAELQRDLTEAAQKLESGTKVRGSIQVCLGGKCRKSGGAELLSEFQNSIRRCGSEGLVEAGACKCMGKCGSAPNVRSENDQETRTLHLGVGFEDVDLIVSRHLLGSPVQVELLPLPASA